MKNIRTPLAILCILVVVGKTIAQRAHRDAPNLFICVNGLCATPNASYSSVVNGSPVVNPPTTYMGVLNVPCNTASCKVWTGKVYINN